MRLVKIEDKYVNPEYILYMESMQANITRIYLLNGPILTTKKTGIDEVKELLFGKIEFLSE